MHIESFDDKFIIYINKKIDLEDISGILLNYKNMGIDIKIYNNMVIYEDKNLGTILELSSDDDYFNSFDINVSISKEENFLLKLEETINFDIDADIYKYKNNYYMHLKENDWIKIGRILEYSKIIYESIKKKKKKEKNKVDGGSLV